jgi:hypothetical protein
LERLDFTLPEWTRVIWTSSIAKGTWEPRLGKIIKAWNKVERTARDSIQVVSPENLPGLVYEMSEIGRVVVPLDKIGRTPVYASSHIPIVEGQPWDYKVALTTPEFVKVWLQAYKEGNDLLIGSLLGYPKCCVEFFIRVWVKERFLDTTWPMVEYSGVPIVGKSVAVKCIPQCNVLMRWVGVRLVPHLPCSFACQKTIESAEVFAKAFKDLDLSEEYNWCMEMLSWPTEWTALHGIAEIKNPVLKVSARTDATGEEYRVHVNGHAYPSEGALGLRFPFTTDKTKIQAPKSMFSDYRFKDNGFSSFEYQETAHKVVTDAVFWAIGEARNKSVFDLGCGNGLLLEKLRIMSSCKAIGVDSGDGKIGRGKYYHPELILDIGDLYDPEIWKYQVGISMLSSNRLMEVDPHAGKALAEKMMKESEFVVLYSYEGDLDPLLEITETFFAPWKARWTATDNKTKAVVLGP